MRKLWHLRKTFQDLCKTMHRKAKVDEKAECTRQYMSISRRLLTQRGAFCISPKLVQLSIALVVAVSMLLNACSNKSEPPKINGVVLPESKQLTPFALKTSKGEGFSEQSLRGHWSLVFFGFTSCAMICPNTLNMMNQVWHKLEQQQNLGDLEFVFVSVDPKRDGLARLDDYVHRFNPSFLGVTGSHSQLHVFAAQLGVPYTVEEGEGDNYFVDHGSMIAVVNPAGQYQAVLTAPYQVEQVTQDLSALRAYYS